MLRQLSVMAIWSLVVPAALTQPLSLYDLYAQGLEADPGVRIAQLQLEVGKAR